jgi:hypothetical protein
MNMNCAILYQGLKIFLDAMRVSVRGELESLYGDQWWEQGVESNFRSEDPERQQQHSA